ncbi:hypothetical protein NE237_016685 [Protea cynaroides]|uniref:Uncharacterized protein n=1 Tax=Protea cynaroides TaxID=273540 RepID=A0A9Q0HE03_9MAGN|nr:hypothetical protein NE237_016685 [Protea cynaroides]
MCKMTKKVYCLVSPNKTLFLFLLFSTSIFFSRVFFSMAWRRKFVCCRKRRLECNPFPTYPQSTFSPLSLALPYTNPSPLYKYCSYLHNCAHNPEKMLVNTIVKFRWLVLI